MRIIHYLSKTLFYITGIIFFVLLTVDPLDLESTRRWAFMFVGNMGMIWLFGYIMVRTEYVTDRRYNETNSNR